MKLTFSGRNFEKMPIILNENPSSGIPVVPWIRTDERAGGRTHMEKLIVAFLNFGKAPKKGYKNLLVLLMGTDTCAPEAYGWKSGWEIRN